MIVATGPEGSGTYLLYWLIRDHLHLTVDHLSMPEGWAPKGWRVGDPPTYDVWWNWEEVEAFWDEEHEPPTRFVIITRNPVATRRSVLRRNLVESDDEHRREWLRALAMLSEIREPYWISYEALVIDPNRVMRELGEWLGVPLLTPITYVRDENAKWLQR